MRRTSNSICGKRNKAQRRIQASSEDQPIKYSCIRDRTVPAGRQSGMSTVSMPASAPSFLLPYPSTLVCPQLSIELIFRYSVGNSCSVPGKQCAKLIISIVNGALKHACGACTLSTHARICCAEMGCADSPAFPKWIRASWVVPLDMRSTKDAIGERVR